MLLSKLRSILLNTKIKEHKKRVQKEYDGGDITIISNNCIAGTIYNILGLKFCSPTINLWFRMSDYLEFVREIRYYISCELVENIVESKKWNFPVGTLKSKDSYHKDIDLHFNHYSSFNSAKDKWEDRKNRIKWDKLYIIYDFNDRDCEINLLYEFEKLPYEHKISLVHREIPDLKYSYKMSCINDNEPLTKEFEYDGLSGKRFFEEWDYLSFLK